MLVKFEVVCVGFIFIFENKNEFMVGVIKSFYIVICFDLDVDIFEFVIVFFVGFQDFFRMVLIYEYKMD